jgi:hypothetical protein
MKNLRVIARLVSSQKFATVAAYRLAMRVQKIRLRGFEHEANRRPVTNVC